MNLFPMFDRIIATPLIDESTQSKIMLPDNGTIKKAKVIAIGEDVKCFQINDIIYYEDFTANKLTIDKCNYIIIKQIDVLAKTIKE